MSLLHHGARRGAYDFASHFREGFYACLTRRGDTLFELTDAMLCENGPVTSPVDLTLLAEQGQTLLFGPRTLPFTDAAVVEAAACCPPWASLCEDLWPHLAPLVRQPHGRRRIHPSIDGAGAAGRQG